MVKRYTPSVKNNNELKQEVVNELKALVYRLGKGKHGALDGDSVAAVLANLREQMSALDNCIGTGEEDIGVLAKDAFAQIKVLKKEADGSVTHRFEEAWALERRAGRLHRIGNGRGDQGGAR